MPALQLTYKAFAVAGGAGGIGAMITKALLAQGAEVNVLSRSTSIVVPQGATVKKVDYTDAGSLSSALQGVQVVVSALSQGGFAYQPALADAAKAAGVQLFVPSEYGSPTHDLPSTSLLYFKPQLQQHLRKIGLPYTLYYTGWFSDFTFIQPFGYDIPNKTLTIVGPGTKPVSFASREDVAHFMAYTLTHLSTEKLENATFGVEGDRLSLLELRKVFEDVYGGYFKLVHRDVAEVEKVVEAKREAAFVEYIQLMAAYGDVLIEKPDNALVPGWKPLTVPESLRKFYS
ncbi:NAD(P)-binding protein [Auriculariales sp. MPI-PUGE-AT-0066]|nr:NAD(P)-binding protein [Auriculariales sp. MPI-PUGE-AT-0066]